MNVVDYSVSVIICAYTEERWSDLVDAIDSVNHQTRPANQIIVVIDHNPALLARVRAAFPTICSIANTQTRGLSGARNSGIAVATGDILVFMDEDAVAAPDWLAALMLAYTDETVLGVGGAIEPQWNAGRPAWFPVEFDWVVGCTYRGMPTSVASVRNLIGCNMSLRREVFGEVGGFRHGIGRVGKHPVGCEETELCIRAQQHWPQRHFVYNPAARVHHRVPSARGNWQYFHRRCYAEGLSKALVTQFVGAADGLSAERTYTMKILPSGVLHGLAAFARGDLAGLGRAGAIVGGLAYTTVGFLRGKLMQQRKNAAGATTSTPIAATQAPADEPSAPNFSPARLLEVELSRPLPALSAQDEQSKQRYQRALSLVRLHDQPIGVLELQLGQDGLSADEYARQIWQKLQQAILAHLQQDGLPPASTLTAAGLATPKQPKCAAQRSAVLAAAPFVSVVIATHNRTESLRETLHSLLALEYPHYNIIVVDNAPSNDATEQMIRQEFAHEARIRYVYEAQAGLAVAHNRGLQEVTAPIVAFTDDDVLVDRNWLTEIVRSFRSAERVGCVTGMIIPAELETPAQGWIEQFGFSKGFEQRIFDMEDHRPPSPLHPYTAGAFGSGANMAFDTQILHAVGGFDPALGAGSLAMGGDDLASFFQIVASGYRLIYQPAAFVRHWHRRDYAGLRRQAYGYGVGLTAYLTKTLVDRPTRLLDFVRRAPRGLQYAFKLRAPQHVQDAHGYPRELTALERQGMLYGPIAYLRSRYKVRRADQRVLSSAR